jgi:hypothetical protein
MQTLYKKVFLSCAILFTLNAFAQEANLFIGTYTQKGSKGIYVYHFDTATGKSIELSHTNNISNPSFLAITKDKQNVYAVNEDMEGGVTSFSFKNNSLKPLQHIPSKGAQALIKKIYLLPIILAEILYSFIVLQMEESPMQD